MTSGYSFPHSKFTQPESYVFLQNYITILGQESHKNRLDNLDIHIRKYTEYLQRININKDYEIILHILKLKMQNDSYLEQFKLDLLGYIYSYIELIIAVIESIDINEIDSTINNLYMIIKYKIIYVIYKTIIILYSYYYYLDFINKTPKQILINFFSYGQNIDTIMNNFFAYLVSIITGNPTITVVNYDYRDAATKSKFFSIVINYFHINILNNPSQNIISKNHIIESYSKIIDKISSISHKQVAQYNFEDVIYMFIYKLYYYDVTTSILANYIKNLYITLPQYLGNCWFIAMLTCMSFSDLSKELLISKIRYIYDNNLYDIIHPNDKILFDNINEIITKITRDHRVYKEIKHDDCTDLVLFKKNFNFMTYIYAKYNEFKSMNPYDIDETIILNNSGSELYHYYYMAFEYNNQIITEQGLSSGNVPTPVGLHSIGLSIITTMYKIFNVKILYFYNYKNIHYFIQNTNNDPDPDIIFIQLYHMEYYYQQMSSNKNNFFTFIRDFSQLIKQIDDSTISFNGNIYKLDYIINKTEDDTTCTNCGHIISGIHYKNHEYYHDSATVMTFLDCSGEQIRIPCSLIKHKWTDKINSRYCIKSCFHNLSKIEDQQIESQQIIEDALCFNNENDILFAYVKQPRQPITSKQPKHQRNSRHPITSITSRAR